MGFTRHRLHFGLMLLVHFCPLHADFFDGSLLLMQTIDNFRDPQSQYAACLQRFQNIREEVAANALLMEEISSLKKEQKKIIPGDTYFLKKRPNNNVNELFFWEISIIMSLNEYVTPSFPFEFAHNHVAIIQPLEVFTMGSWIVNLPPRVTQKVSLRDYFRAHILAFLLGAGDLSGMNIGVTPNQSIRFFDNEDLFTCDLCPRETAQSFYVPFVSVAFDWPHYRKKINAQLASELVELITELEEKKEDLIIYSGVRDLPENFMLRMNERIELLSSFQFTAGTSFLDFVFYLYPQLSEGLDELNSIVSGILHRRVDHGISLFFVTRMMKFSTLSDRDKHALTDWIKQYVQLDRVPIES